MTKRITERKLTDMTPELRFTYKASNPIYSDTATETKTFDTLKEFVKNMNSLTTTLDPCTRIESVLIYGKYVDEDLSTIEALFDYCNARLKYKPEKRITLQFYNELTATAFLGKEHHFTKIGLLTYETSYEILLKTIIAKLYSEHKLDPLDISLDFVRKTASFKATCKINQQETALTEHLTTNGIKDKDIIEIYSDGNAIVIQYQKTKDIGYLLDNRNDYENTCKHYGIDIFDTFAYTMQATEHPVTGIPCVELTTDRKHTLREWIRTIQDAEGTDCEVQLVEGTFHAIIDIYCCKPSQLMPKGEIHKRQNRIVDTIWRAEKPDQTHAYYILLSWDSIEGNKS